MIREFFRHYLELPKQMSSVVCLGGGVGTSQLLKGLRTYEFDLTAVVSMADDGGSAGRLRRAFSILPPGDLVTCLTAMSEEESTLKNLLTYRFSGDRYGQDTDIRGQKLGNLIFLALFDIYKGDANLALEEFSKIITVRGRVLPATTGDVNIWALTKNGKKVYGEENIDLGRYNDHVNSLSEVHLDPPNPRAFTDSVKAVSTANLIVAGPGDLFSTVLPVLIVPQIKKTISASKSKKIVIVNIANKPFETAGFAVSDFLRVIKNHLGENFFDYVLVNTNQKPKIPSKIKYAYVKYDREKLGKYAGKIIEGDFIDNAYPIYHDSAKLAKAVSALI